MCRSNTACPRRSTEVATQDRMITFDLHMHERRTPPTSGSLTSNRGRLTLRRRATACLLKPSASSDTADRTLQVRSRVPIAPLEARSPPTRATTTTTSQATNAMEHEAHRVLSRARRSPGKASRVPSASPPTSHVTRATSTSTLPLTLAATLAKHPRQSHVDQPMGTE